MAATAPVWIIDQYIRLISADFILLVSRCRKLTTPKRLLPAHAFAEHAGCSTLWICSGERSFFNTKITVNDTRKQAELLVINDQAVSNLFKMILAASVTGVPGPNIPATPAL